MNKRKIIISTITTTIFLLLTFFISQKMGKQKKSTIASKEIAKSIRKVKVDKPEYIDAESYSLQIDGRLVPYEKVELFSKVTGIIEQSPKDYKSGTYYSKGETIFRLNADEDKYNLISTRSTLLNAITQMMPDLKFDYPETFTKWEHYLNHFDLNSTTPALPIAEHKQEKYFVASKNIYNIYYNIKSIESRLSSYQIESPINGVVTSALVYKGMMVRPGQSLGTMISNTQFELEAPIPLSDMEYVKIGQKVSLKSKDLGLTWSGTVKRLGQKIDETTQSLPVYIAVSGSQLREGMYLSGQILGKPLANVMALDKRDLVDQSSVFTVVDSILQKREVNIIKRSGDKVYIQPLLDNPHIVRDVLTGLYEGQKVVAVMNKDSSK